MSPSPSTAHGPVAGSRPTLRSTISHGLLAGASGTAAHTAVMWLSQQVDQFRQPPQVIVDTVVAAVDADGRGRDQRRVLAATSHVAFGVANGILFSVLHRMRGFRGATAFGLAYGIGLYTVSYAGLIPFVGILPVPNRDQRSRQVALVAAHLAYGATAGQVISRFRPD